MFKKDDAGKLRESLMCEDFVDQMIRVLEHGAVRYGEWNWLKGGDWTRFSNANARHTKAWKNFEKVDQDSGINHLAHAAVNLMFLYCFEANQIGNDDRPGNQLQKVAPQRSEPSPGEHDAAYRVAWLKRRILTMEMDDTPGHSVNGPYFSELGALKTELWGLEK
tara:strand:- start:398 stop:889 length:492 start_codon:yes stop_codon:yes gene_type:complete